MRSPTPSNFISIDDAAELFGVSSKTIRRRVADNTIPAFRAGRQIRIRRKDAERAFLSPMNEAARELVTKGAA